MTDPERVEAAVDPAFQAFAAEAHAPELDSWLVDHVVKVPGGSIELWRAPVARGLIKYVHLAAAKDSSGAITAIAAVETMPGVHSETYLGLFEKGPVTHQNFGEAPELIDVDAFFERAQEFLALSRSQDDPPTGG
jgi:hypothetical protein